MKIMKNKLKTLIAVGALTITTSLFAYTPVTTHFELGGKDYKVTFDKSPERAVTTSQFMTEMLLSLGLEDKMVGTAWADNEMLPELKDAYKKVPILSDQYPSKEVFYGTNPDFISGWTSVLSAKNLGDTESLIAHGVKPLIISSIEKGASVQTVYNDYETLGKIFDVQDKAEKVIKKLKDAVKEANEIKGNHKTVRVFAYDSGKDAPFTVAGEGLGNDMIAKAGGENIFNDLKGNFASVSWEKVLERDPQEIVIIQYGDTSAKTKIDFLKNNEFTKELDAVKNNKFTVVTLSEMSPGPRMAMAIKHLANGFYGKN